MDIFFDLLKIILPALIAALSTFIVTKYTYNKNRPLDKIEIAYNRVYYPIYKLISNSNDIEVLICKSKFYLDKYEKYVDRSTLKAFKALCSCETDTKKKANYNIFHSNITNKNSYLRRRLGYLEPSLLQIYKYSTSSEKSSFRILLELFSLYSVLIVFQITKGFVNSLMIILFSIIILILIIEIIIKFFLSIYYKIKK